MKRFVFFAMGIIVAFVLTATSWAGERTIVQPNAAQKFATLPTGIRFPEGITADPHTGEIYVSTFDGGGDNRLLRFDKSGKLAAQTDTPGPTPLLGLAFNPLDHKVYIASVGDFVGTGSKIQRIEADFADGAAFEDVTAIPVKGAPPNRTVMNPDGSEDLITFGNNARVPNALTFNVDGDLFVSDSFQGAIFRVDDAAACPGCLTVEVVHSGLLATAGFPPFGANGLALNNDQSELFIANTGDDRVLRLDLTTKIISVFAESINGADGIAFDQQGRLWVAANQADQVVALDENGKVIAELGEFLRVRHDGSVDGLLFPASLVIVGNRIFVTNLALPLNAIAGDEPEEEVTRFTVSQIYIPGNL